MENLKELRGLHDYYLNIFRKAWGRKLLDFASERLKEVEAKIDTLKTRIEI